MPRILQIALPLPLDRLFDYLLPANLSDTDLIGKRALVPLGKRVMTGYIVGERVEEITDKIKPILELLDVHPVFSEKMLDFAKWISEYYMASLGETLKAALPQGMSPQSVIKVTVIRKTTIEEEAAMKTRSPKRFELLNFLKSCTDAVSVKNIETSLEIENISPQLKALVELGIIAIERFTPKDLRAKQQLATMIADEIFDDDSVRQACSGLEKTSPQQSALLATIYLMQKAQGLALVSEVLSKAKASRSALNALQKIGLIKVEKTDISRIKKVAAEARMSNKNELEIELTDEQAIATRAIEQAIEEQNCKPFLLHGVTGSGKTLVYMRAIRKAIELGRTVLLLVPEISLTPQLIDRFETSFAGSIAVLHSRMSEGERYDQWSEIHSGKKQIVIGARSAVFAPMKNLGLIIVDEEHEPSYKQDNPSPRYHCRDSAIVRAKMENAVVVLGSATPSMESMYNARQGRYRLLEIKKRADGAMLPSISVIDIAEERRRHMMHGAYSDKLLQKITEKNNKNEGVIIFQNRRGFSNFVQCLDCGHIPQCVNCSVSLTYHKAKRQLRCHYCGFTVKMPEECPECGSVEIREVGFGTQRIETELDEIMRERGFSSSIVRMDLDTTSRKGAHRRILTDFAKGEFNILLGTQMVAKGLDFDRVSLVGVVNADMQLFMPDFRASERTFQLLTQVAGRAGRSGTLSGEVMIQTSHPTDAAIEAVLNSSYEQFYEYELYQRQKAGYPPFSRFIYIEFSGKELKNVSAAAEYYASMLPKDNTGFSLLGPTAPSIEKLRSNFRRIIIIKSKKETDRSGKKIRYYIARATEQFRKKYSRNVVSVTVDIDSYSCV